MKITLLRIISVAATAAAVNFASVEAEKLDANSSGSLERAGTFPPSNQNVLATALFPLSNAETGAMAAAFLPLLLLSRLNVVSPSIAPANATTKSRQNAGLNALFLRE